MLPAVKAVFETTEILESILHKLPTRDGATGMKTVLVAQRVCRRWRLVIQASAKIQRALFFQPVNVEALVFRLFDDAYPRKCTCSWFTETGQSHPVYANQLLGPLFTAVCNRYACLPPSWQRPEASWRRMMLTQPGIILRCTISISGETELVRNFNTKTRYAGGIYGDFISKIRYYASNAEFEGRGITWTGPGYGEQIERMHLGW